MDTVLAAVTLVSLLVAIGMTILAWRLLREERRRSDARIALLVAERAAAARPEVEQDIVSDWRHGRPAATSSPTAPSAPRELFVEGTPSLAGLGPAPIIAAAVLVVGMVASLIVVNGPASTPDVLVTAPAAQPLELLTLMHDRLDDTLVIRGTVRNPDDGGEQRNLVAVVSLFDRAGDLLGTSRAALEQLVLGRGATSPFVVSAPAERSVGRYRISFRDADDAVMPHVDRRDASPDDAGLRAGRKIGTP